MPGKPGDAVFWARVNAALADWAQAHDTAFAAIARDDARTWPGGTSPREYMLVQLDFHRSRVWDRQPWAAASVLGWLRVLAGAPDQDAVFRVSSMLTTHPDLAADPADTLAPWAPVGALAPWAYAAGLTPEEALTRIRTGDLPMETVQAMAALRGYRLPPAGLALT